MSHSAAAIPPGQPIPEPGVEPDGIDSASLAVWGLVSVLIVVAVIFGAAALFFQTQRQLNEARIVAPDYDEAVKTLSDQRGVLASYGAPATEGQPYHIPIDAAKDLVLAELQD